MIDRDKVFDAFRNCITEPKCKNCPWEQCEQFNQKKVEIPVTLALDVIELLKEQETVVRCKDCKHGSLYCTEDVCGETLIECNRPDLGDAIEIHGWKWFCADGEKKGR